MIISELERMREERRQTANIREHFADLEDPRDDRGKHHLLHDILVVAICGVICGADGWVGVEEFGQSKYEWLDTFLELPSGIPSHDTFGRVFARLDPEQFQRGFLSWVRSIAQVTEGEIIPLDGKMLRGSHDGVLGQSAIHMVSAWASHNRLTLGQVKVDEKSNEITALPELLQALALEGCIVTIDAMGCQTDITDLIVEQGADYVLALKGNQGRLHREVQDLFAFAHETKFQDIASDFHQPVDKDHGRIEIRRYWTISDPEFIAYVDPEGRWASLRCIGMVEAERRIGDDIEKEIRYFISSLPGEAAVFGEAVRPHWGIENGLHWILDIASYEDDSRICKGHGPENFALLRRLALNLLEQEITARCGIRNKRPKAGWDEDYLLNALAAQDGK